MMMSLPQHDNLESELQQRARLSKLVDTWSTREDLLAEQEAERERKELLGVITHEDFDDWTDDEQAERFRLALLVQEWYDGRRGRMQDVMKPSSSFDFDVPHDYIPKCLTPMNDNDKPCVATTSNVDRPRLTFDTPYEFPTANDWDVYREECTRLAALVRQWDVKDVDDTEHAEGQDKSHYYSPQEKQERARLARKVDEWSQGLYLWNYTNDAAASTAPTFECDLSEDEIENGAAITEYTNFAMDLDEEKLRLAKLVDEWTTGIGPFPIKNNHSVPVISFDDVLMPNDVQDPERIRLEQLVDEWEPEETTTIKMDPWERFQRMLKAEAQERESDGRRGGCLCFRIMPHRKPALA